MIRATVCLAPNFLFSSSLVGSAAFTCAAIHGSGSRMAVGGTGTVLKASSSPLSAFIKLTTHFRILASWASAQSPCMLAACASRWSIHHRADVSFLSSASHLAVSGQSGCVSMQRVASAKIRLRMPFAQAICLGLPVKSGRPASLAWAAWAASQQARQSMLSRYAILRSLSECLPKRLTSSVWPQAWVIVYFAMALRSFQVVAGPNAPPRSLKPGVCDSIEAICNPVLIGRVSDRVNALVRGQVYAVERAQHPVAPAGVVHFVYQLRSCILEVADYVVPGVGDGQDHYLPSEVIGGCCQAHVFVVVYDDVLGFSDIQDAGFDGLIQDVVKILFAKQGFCFFVQAFVDFHIDLSFSVGGAFFFIPSPLFLAILYLPMGYIASDEQKNIEKILLPKSASGAIHHSARVYVSEAASTFLPDLVYTIPSHFPAWNPTPP
nr:MAG TPA_asm: hypothetical protein [Bacteriophage sp.]